MKLHVVIGTTKYSIISYSYRLNNVDSDTKVSHIFSCVVVAEDSTISVGNFIYFYADDVLVYVDPINKAIINGTRITIESKKTINATTNKTVNIDNIMFYSSTTIRTNTNFNLIPLDDIVTPVGNFIAKTIVNYGIYSEIRIG